MRTSFYAILCIVIRLGAVFLAFGAISRVPYAVVAWDQGMSATAVGSSLGVIGLILALALALWIYPGAIARLAAGRNSREVFESPISPAELQWIAFSVLGVYFAVDALVALTHYGVRWAILANASMSDLSYYLIQLGAGFLLAFGARGLATMLRRMRYGDTAGATMPVDTEGASSESTR